MVLALDPQKIKITFVLCLLACFLSGTICIFQKDAKEEKAPLDKIISNEIETFENLKKIFKAQQKYYNADFDRDGIKSFALFIAHLWQTVDKKSYPVETRLVSKKLAFAMGETKAINGYFFMTICLKEVKKVDKKNSESNSGNVGYNDFDFTREWAMKAIPASYKFTGMLKFIVTQTGKIYAKDMNDERITSVPEDYVPVGWQEINGKADIINLHPKNKE